MDEEQTLASRHALGTAAFAFAGPPLLAVVIVPWLLSGWELREPLGWAGARWLGAALVAAGAGVVAATMTAFVRRGHGTPAPWAPPVRLVPTGLYAHSRNPMYVGVVALVAGEGLLLGSVPVLVWAAVLLIGFHVWVVLVEEPALARRHGAAYDDYRAAVPRWLGRRRAT